MVVVVEKRHISMSPNIMERRTDLTHAMRQTPLLDGTRSGKVECPGVKVFVEVIGKNTLLRGYGQLLRWWW